MFRVFALFELKQGARQTAALLFFIEKTGEQGITAFSSFPKAAQSQASRFRLIGIFGKNL